MFKKSLLAIGVILQLIIIISCKSSTNNAKQNDTKLSHSSYIEIKHFADSKYSNDTASIGYYNEDSMLISSISFYKPHVPEIEMFYSKFSNDLTYGLAIFYDTIPFQIKHVEVIGVVASQSRKRFRVFSGEYLRKIDSVAFNKWIKKTIPDYYDYQIDTYH